LYIENFSGIPYTEEENNTLMRFGKVFQQTYTRFLDLQKAEAQAREAEIELALERVRARTMAMQRSDELPETSFLLFHQFRELGENAEQISIGIMNEEDHVMELSATLYGNRLQQTLKLKIDESSVQKKIYNAWKQKKKSIVIDLAGKELQEYNVYRNNLSGYQGVKFDEDDENHWIINVAFFSKGMLSFSTHEHHPPETIQLLERFAQVFDQTYTRFLDLQKAESQAREANIETALERVRSKTMAMQRSDELLDVASVLFQQVKALGVPQWNCGFNIWDIGDKEFTYYPGSPDGKILPSPCKIPLTEHPVFMRFDESRKRGDELLIYEKQGEEQKDHYQYMLSLPGVGDLLKSMLDAGFKLPTFQIDHLANFAYGNLIFITYEHFPEMHDVFKRFARVFEQTYTRFLDLQKAEAQAREAQIQLAMERVRARTMAMQKSDELPEAANLLFQQVQVLGMPAWSAGYCIWDDNKKAITAWMSSEGVLQPSFRAPLTEDSSFINMREAYERGETFHVEEIGGDELVQHYKYMRTLPVVGDVLDSIIEAGHPLPTFQIFHCIYFSQGFLLFITYEPVPDAHDIFKRFGKVFDQTYTRFLDLQKAEAQAREAKIEAALERVRSQSMGMQTSKDLSNVTTAMFEQLRMLGGELYATGIVFCDKYENHVEQWHSVPGAGMLSPFIVPVDLDHIHQYRYDQWKKGTELFSVEIPKDFIAQHFDAMFNLPTVKAVLEDFAAKNIPMPETPSWEIDYGASFKHGYILVSALQPFSDADILPRFAKVFDQTYTRFLDLQKVEAQVREAKIEAALERVRSRTLAMQTSNELAETAAVLFRQLILLGIEPNRLYINIIKNENGEAEFWITDEDGSKVSSAFESNMNDNPSFKRMFEGWKEKKKSLLIDMKEKELKEYFLHLESLHVPFKDGLTQKRRLQYVAYFNKGFIGLASPDEQPEETMLLLERFAAVFNLTFTRFNDLKIAEGHAIQAEEDLIKLQTEKKRVEDALTELQITQKQLIQSEKMASLGELTAGIAHEIQNPLNFVNNFSEVSNELIDELKEEFTKGNTADVFAIADDLKLNLEKINHHGKRADAIVKGMLQHSQASSATKEPTDINKLADEYLRLSYHGLRAKDKSFNATLETDFDETIGDINIIPQDIGRVILNLITNAFYAVDEKKKLVGEGYEPTVLVSTKKLNDKVEIKVSDNGNGIPPKVLDKIFQPFFTTKPTGQGTGLGLSLAYDIAKAHGGEIKVSTKENEETKFTIILPA
jgi:signal transduction histidine kinase